MVSLVVVAAAFLPHALASNPPAGNNTPLLAPFCPPALPSRSKRQRPPLGSAHQAPLWDARARLVRAVRRYQHVPRVLGHVPRGDRAELLERLERGRLVGARRRQRQLQVILLVPGERPAARRGGGAGVALVVGRGGAGVDRVAQRQRRALGERAALDGGRGGGGAVGGGAVGFGVVVVGSTRKRVCVYISVIQRLAFGALGSTTKRAAFKNAAAPRCAAPKRAL